MTVIDVVVKGIEEIIYANSDIHRISRIFLERLKVKLSVL